MQSIGNLKVNNGGVAWNKAGGGKEIKIAAKGECLSQAQRKRYDASHAVRATKHYDAIV